MVSAIVSFVKASVNEKDFSNRYYGGGLSSTTEILPEFQEPDTNKLPYPLKPDELFASEKKFQSPLYLPSIANITVTVEYDPKTKQYIIYEKVGNINIRTPRVMSEEEYRSFQFENAMREYWYQRRNGETVGRGSGILQKIQVGGETFDRIFGSNTIEIIPEGNAELQFGISAVKTNNPDLPVDQRKNATFDFQSKIQMNVDGKIGEKMRMNVQYNTEATFDFENNVKVEYTGFEDEIIQKIEAGNVSLPLPGTLITGSQSLFGFKTQLKFGKLMVTSIFSKQNGQTQVIEVKGGAQTKDFELSADEYEANKHFFLSQYFRETYNQTLQNLPIINTGINITKIEVWVTNKQSNFENSRNILAFIDLAETQNNIFASTIFSQQYTEPGTYPFNDRNDLYSQMTSTFEGIRNIADVKTVLSPLEAQNFSGGKDYEKIENARKLNPSEYKLNPKLGYISLNTALNGNEVLAVAFEYSLGGKTYKVGELSTDGITAPKTLILKLLKGTSFTPKLPTWKLMMKNIYAIGAYQVSKEEFMLDVLYHSDATGTTVNYINEGNIANKPLISVLSLDNLNSQNDAMPDGLFDFVEDITIKSATGKIIFPVLEPFGSDLARKIGSPEIAERYVFQELYDSTLTKARQIANKNKFKLAGSYRSVLSSEIYLNATNIPKGSIIVTAGGAKLVEDNDYTVDYNLGSIKITNAALIESGTPIKISLESNSMFSMQTKTLIGSHFNYQFSDKFNLGATVINLNERPFTTKVSFGNEAVSNTMLGLNTSYSTEAPFLTKMVDFLPFIQTKEKSTITLDAEFAQFIPGASRALGKNGTVYLDDFEGTTNPIDIRYWTNWHLSGTPQGQPDLFPEASLNNDRRYGYNRAKLAWYFIDPLFLRESNYTPRNINNSSRSNHWVREIFQSELFPNKQAVQGEPTNIPVLNLAFYPNERGPYNYDVTGTDITGKLLFPQKRWGGIMYPINISNTDFETQNVEYIEFWLMDPFVDPDGDEGPMQAKQTGGDLYFNLGNLSEDILRDGHRFLENGMPTSSEMKNIDSTAWGRVPTIQSIPKGFAVDAQKRKFQDVGLDGLRSADLDNDGVNDEASFFADFINQMAAIPGLDPKIFAEIEEDPSNDNYRYFLSSYYDDNNAGILDRYKNYNSMEGNSPADEQTNSTSSSKIPDGEDVNSDETMSEDESYFQYRISLRPQDMEVGRNYITDKVTRSNIQFANGHKSSISWYQFKVPIREYQKKIGPIEDFKSISFVRMFLRDFSDTVILRFATLQLIKGEWRKYNLALIEGQEGMPAGDLSIGSFDISSVNIEKNDSRTPVNYVLPPGVEREIDPSQQQYREQNEQSMELKVEDLADGDARAAFKTVSLDIRQYRRMKMDIHAEEIPGKPLNDDEVSLFVRLGSDQANNYYEYEIPLKLTPPRSNYNNNKVSDRKMVWPRENFLDIDLEIFQDIKMARNDQMHKEGSNITYSTVFTKTVGDRRIKVTGNPSLSNIRVLMIGIRNPGRSGNPDDDGLSKSTIVWVNEMRLSNFDDKAGWAANARLSAKLADLGMVTVAGSTIKPGFGSIEKKINERSKDDFYQYDISSTVELGRFFPKKSGIKIPLYVGYSEAISNPEYNPLDPDIPLRVALKNAPNKQVSDSIKNISQDYSRRKTINFTNVQINRPEAKPWLLSLSNFSASYSYSEQFSRNIKIDHRVQRNIRGALTYNYNSKIKSIVPFKKVNWMNSKYLRIVKDFNFNPFPSQISFRTDLNRNYFEQQQRNITNPTINLLPTYSKDFLWNRIYSLNWDLTQALKFDFNATNVARIDEPLGIVDRRHDRDSYEHWKDSVWNNMLNLGRNTQYNHQFNLTYSLPLNKIPFLDWTSATARYSGNYNWKAGPILADTSKFDPGNTIQNSNSMQLNGQINVLSLFNKVEYFKNINQKFDQMARGGSTRQQPKMNTVKYEEKDVNLRANSTKSIYHRLKTENVTVKVYDESGKEIKVITDIKNDERVTIKTDKDYKKAKVVVEGKVPEKVNPLKLVYEGTLRVLMGVKNISLSYAETNGTLVPGYKPGTRYLGMENFAESSAPGFGFISGWQDPDFPWRAIGNGWLSKDTSLSNPFVFTHNENLTFRSTVEPLPGFRIEISANRSYSRNHNEYYHADRYGNFSALSPLTTGNFSMTVLSLGSAFEKSNAKNDYFSKAFEEFRNSREVISQRLGTIRENGSTQGYQQGSGDFKNGYSDLSQNVLIPAFLASYTNFTPRNAPLIDFPAIPFPNWQVTYEGLAKLKMFKKYLRTFTITHGYRSVYTIGSFTTNLDYLSDDDGFSYTRNAVNDFISKREIANVSISEQFSPLIGVDMNWVNSLTTRVEIKSSRTLALSLANSQLTETKGWEYIVGTGYRFENLPLIFGNEKGEQRTLKSDLRLRMDFSLRNNKTVLRKVVENSSTITTGQLVWSVKTSADYVINEKVTIRAFFDRTVNSPLVSIQLPTANTNFGFSIRFTLTQ